MKPILASVLIALLVLSLQPFTQSQETPNANKQQQAAQRSTEPTSIPTATATAQVRKPTPTQNAGEHNTNLNHNWFDWYAAFGPSTWSNWMLAVFATVATIIGLRSLARIKEQNREAAIALRINRAAASAAKEGAKVAARELVIANRAYVSIENMAVTEFLPDGRPWVNYTLRNTGRVPASRVGDGAVFFYTSATRPFQPSGTGNYSRPPDVGDVLAPNESVERRWRLERWYTQPPEPFFTKEQISDALGGKLFIELGIPVSYVDGFGNERMTIRIFLYDADLREWRRFGARQD